MHRLRQGIHRQVVVGHLRHLVPIEPRGVFDRFLQLRTSVAVGHDVQPVAVAPVLGDAPLVGSEENRPGRATEPLHLDQAQFTRVEIGTVRS